MKQTDAFFVLVNEHLHPDVSTGLDFQCYTCSGRQCVCLSAVFLSAFATDDIVVCEALSTMDFHQYGVYSGEFARTCAVSPLCLLRLPPVAVLSYVTQFPVPRGSFLFPSGFKHGGVCFVLL